MAKYGLKNWFWFCVKDMRFGDGEEGAPQLQPVVEPQFIMNGSKLLKKYVQSTYIYRNIPLYRNIP